MSLTEEQRRRLARDEFSRYYTEKIWEWIPAIYRHEDGLAENEGVLRAIVEILARQAAVARRSVDRLWEDQFIDYCDDWSIPYLADLVGTRPIHELNRRGRRVDVAKTLFYRRRKGTPVVLEALIRDITGWEGAVVESFRRLARARHGLDPEPDRLAGPVTGSLPGGWANLRGSRGGDLVDGPFDEFAHTPDFRQLRGDKGRYNIPKLNFHLYRLGAFEVELATPFALGERRYTFDPSGRDGALFRPARRPEPDACEPVAEWRLPAPMPCRLLGDARYELALAGLAPAIASRLAPWAGERFVTEARLRETLLTVLTQAELDANVGAMLVQSLTPASPKGRLLPAAVAVAVGADSGVPSFGHEATVAGELEDWGASISPPADKALVVDPVRGRFLLLSDPGTDERVFVPRYHYGFSGPFGAGSYDRRESIVGDGVIDLPGGAQTGDGDELEPGPIAIGPLPVDGVHQLVNSKTYTPELPADNVVADVDQLCLQAANRQRPYLRLVPEGGADAVTLTALAKPDPVDPDDENQRRLLSLEGLWLGIVPGTLAAQTLADPDEACVPVPTRLVLDGVYDRVLIRHCTIDPGGEQARVEPLSGTPVPLVILEIQGQVEELVIESSVVGPIHGVTDADDPCAVGSIVIRDSVVHSLDPAVAAIGTRVGEVRIERSTVFGDVRVNRLYASEALIQGRVQVTDNQHGCFRFSAANRDPSGRLPPQFESHLFAPAIPNHFFVSRRFGDAGYAQLSESAPQSIERGGENRSEIGVCNRLLNPIKLDDLRVKVNEYMPFGLIAQFIKET